MAAARSTELLADRQEIIDLTIAYCWAIDTRNWDALDDVFLPDATALLAVPAPLEGVAAIRERISRALTPLDDSQHIVANHQVVIDGDGATCRCYLQAQHVRRAAAESGGGTNFIIAGRYEDRMVRTPNGWRIAFRELVPMWREGNPDVLVR
jgi:ketosteroid isomerase-like protein